MTGLADWLLLPATLFVIFGSLIVLVLRARRPTRVTFKGLGVTLEISPCGGQCQQAITSPEAKA